VKDGKRKKRLKFINLRESIQQNNAAIEKHIKSILFPGMIKLFCSRTL